MAIRIAHISDIHYSARNQIAVQPFAKAIQDCKPDFVVCTGDLVDQPSKSNVSDAKSWIEQIVHGCGVAPEKFLIVPGNHDYGYWGSIGISLLTGRWYTSAFKDKWQDAHRVRSFPDEKLIFVQLDSNPGVLDVARGHVGSGQLRFLSTLFADVPLEMRNNATKIALIHHHCLPVFNEPSSDRYLVLKDAPAVIKFLADHGINLVLHGHKHRATHSFLAVGGVSVGYRVIEVLAAAPAIKSQDIDPRGHNFNLITIEDTRFRSITQYFSNPAGDDFVPSETSHRFAFERIAQLYQENFKNNPFRMKSIQWDLRVDLQGDRFNVMSYRGFSFNPAVANQNEYSPPPYTVLTGSVPAEEIKLDGNPGIHLDKQPQTDMRKAEFKIRFEDPPYRNGSDFTIGSWDLNAIALSEKEFHIKHPNDSELLEFEEKTINSAIENFTWHLSFPAEFKLEGIRFDVYAADSEAKQTVLTEMLRSGFAFSKINNTACLSLQKPPSGYRYRISWRIKQNPSDPLGMSATASEAIPPRAQVDFDKLKRYLKDARDQNRQSPWSASRMADPCGSLLSYREMLVDRIGGESGMKTADIELEMGFMMYDGAQKPGKLQTMMHSSQDATLWDFSLEYGDGNAGRAYKFNMVRVWPKREEPGAPANWYAPGPGKKHRFLCSIPIRHPKANSLIIGILNIGSFHEPTAKACLFLDTPEEAARLLDDAIKYVLTNLMEHAKVWTKEDIKELYGNELKAS